MKINDVIRTRRQALGLTQEVLADRLGVSAPAVNKWEKGANYPDITLLPALARTLGVDMNTLLSFQEDIRREEIEAFLRELSETARAEGPSAAFQTARDKLREFPGSDLLACNTAGVLDGILALYPDGGGEARQELELEVAALYERSAHSADPQIREWAAYVVASRCVGKGDLERAEALLEQLPDTHKGKQALAACLRVRQGRREEAWVLLEKELFGCANTLQTVLLHMTDLALAEGGRDRAKALSDLASRLGRDLELPGCAALSAPLQLALTERDGQRALALLEKLLDSLASPWSPRASTLYRHLPAGRSSGQAQEMILQPLLDQLETETDSQFLRETAGYRELVGKYRPSKAWDA